MENIDRLMINDAKTIGMTLEEFTKRIDRRWYQAQTYDDLLGLNIEFILGKIYGTPYHSGPLELEFEDQSLRLVNNLVKLHEHGILSVNGQEPLCRHWDDDGYENYDVTNYSSIEQRGYLCFHVNIENNLGLAESLIEQLKTKNSTVIYNIKNLKNSQYFTNMPLYSIFCQYKTYLPSQNIYHYYNLTRISTTKCKEVWKNITNFWNRSDNMCSDWGFVTNEKFNEILQNTIFFELALPEYGKGNLEEILIDMCQYYYDKKRKNTSDHEN
jgi:hypothetical protein